MEKFSEILEVNLSKAAIAYLTYKFLSMTKRKFTEWEAYKLGLIDVKGNLVKKPKTKEEKTALDATSNLVRKIKKLLGKYIPNEKLLAFLITIYLLKENIDNKTNNDLACRLQEYLSPEENDLIVRILQEHKK